MSLPPLYLQKVPTDDSTLAKYAPGVVRRDVVARKSPDGPICARWTWFGKTPDRRNRYVMLNCYRWQAIWLPDA